MHVVVLSVAFYLFNAECRYAECRYAERRYAERRYAERRYAEHRSAVLASFKCIPLKSVSGVNNSE